MDKRCPFCGSKAVEVSTYFEEMGDKLDEYNEKTREYNKQIEEIINGKALSFEELAENCDAVYHASKDDITCPYSNGEIKAYEAYKKGVECKDFPILMSIRSKDVKDFVETMKESGETKFILADDSSGLMQSLYDFWREHCYVRGLMTYRENSSAEAKKGVLIEL